MTSVKVKFRSSSVAQKEGTIYFQLIHLCKVKHIRTGYRLFPEEWNTRLEQVDITAGKDAARTSYLGSLKRNLQNGVLSYRRNKTGQQLYIKWEQPMQELIDKYDTSGTPYLLPILQNNGVDEWKQYHNEIHRVNRNLKIIGKQLGLPIPLTTYVARHAWASIAQSKRVSLPVISEALGHDSEQTTRIYLASLDTAVVDKANRLILQSI